MGRVEYQEIEMEMEKNDTPEIGEIVKTPRSLWIELHNREAGGIFDPLECSFTVQMTTSLASQFF